MKAAFGVHLMKFKKVTNNIYLYLIVFCYDSSKINGESKQGFAFTYWGDIMLELISTIIGSLIVLILLCILPLKINKKKLFFIVTTSLIGAIIFNYLMSSFNFQIAAAAILIWWICITVLLGKLKDEGVNNSQLLQSQTMSTTENNVASTVEKKEDEMEQADPIQFGSMNQHKIDEFIRSLTEKNDDQSEQKQIEISIPQTEEKEELFEQPELLTPVAQKDDVLYQEELLQDIVNDPYEEVEQINSRKGSDFSNYEELLTDIGDFTNEEGTTFQEDNEITEQANKLDENIPLSKQQDVKQQRIQDNNPHYIDNQKQRMKHEQVDVLDVMKKRKDLFKELEEDLF